MARAPFEIGVAHTVDDASRSLVDPSEVVEEWSDARGFHIWLIWLD